MVKKTRPRCPECGTIMAKYGFIWSGRNKRQRYRCRACGRVTMEKGQK